MASEIGIPWTHNVRPEGISIHFLFSLLSIARWAENNWPSNCFMSQLWFQLAECFHLLSFNDLPALPLCVMFASTVCIRLSIANARIIAQCILGHANTSLFPIRSHYWEKKLVIFHSHVRWPLSLRWDLSWLCWCISFCIVLFFLFLFLWLSDDVIVIPVGLKSQLAHHQRTTTKLRLV